MKCQSCGSRMSKKTRDMKEMTYTCSKCGSSLTSPMGINIDSLVS